MASLTSGQRQIVQRIVRIGRQVGATPKEIKAALETGRVESNFSNPQHATDHDSIGWRQERASLYPNPGNLDASIRRFFQETKAVRDKYGNSGALAAAVQRPAAQYRGRYAQVSGEAQRLLEQAFSGRIAAPGRGGGGQVRTIPGRPGSTRTESTTTVIPGVDNRVARASLIQSFLDSNSSIDPLDFAMQARQLQDVAPSSTTETKTFRTPGTSGRSVHAPGRGGTSSQGARSSFGSGRGNAGRRGPVAHLTSEGGEHPTLGLSGFPARDYFAHPGSAAVAPINGTVVRLSGHDPALGPTQGPHGPLGWSVYIKGDDGHTYFLTHMGSRSVKPGQRVRSGQKIGTVANYDKYGTPSHIHMGVQ